MVDNNFTMYTKSLFRISTQGTWSLKLVATLTAIACLISPSHAQRPKDFLNSCEPGVAVSAAREILADPRSHADPTEMYLPSLVLFLGGFKDEGMLWFFATTLRTAVMRPLLSAEHGQAEGVMLHMVAPPIYKYALQNPIKAGQIHDEALVWQKKTPIMLRGRQASAEQLRHLEATYASFMESKMNILNNSAQLMKQIEDAGPNLVWGDREPALDCDPKVKKKPK
jgi:hypothetical protein